MYRYGFNGKENDSETSTQDYGMRIYDPRVARFLSVDPIAKEYPELTPYQFASGNPIENIDLDGLEGIPYRYANAQQLFYQAGADLVQGLGRAYDKLTSFIVSNKTEIISPSDRRTGTSVQFTNENSLSFGGRMEAYVYNGRYSSNNTMPKLKISDFWSVEKKSQNTVELRNVKKAGNAELENKTSLDGSVVSTKLTIKKVKLLNVPVPLDISGQIIKDANGEKAKIEAKTSTEPMNVGLAGEVSLDKEGRFKEGKVGVQVQFKSENKNGATIKNTTAISKQF